MQISKVAQEIQLKKTQVEIKIHELQNEFGLTSIEMLQALASASDTILKYELRYERHQNYDKPSMYPGEWEKNRADSNPDASS